MKQKSSLDINEKIVNFNVPRASLLKHKEKQYRKECIKCHDLRNIKNKSDSSVYEHIKSNFYLNNYFVNAGPILININPGPLHREYLDLEKWIEENSNKPKDKWKPHLYTFINYVFYNMIKEKQSQTVCIIGENSSGKTFNLIHSINYLSNLQMNLKVNDNKREVFETIHKSIQLIHIMGSIFRNDNIESTTISMLVKCGFNSEGNFSNFEIESDIFDLTLPFSISGRSFSIIHAIISGASKELKRQLEISEIDIYSSFFKKYNTLFNKQNKERLYLNDLEIWNKFHSLMDYFLFSKTEVFDILQTLLSIILLNDLTVTKQNEKSNIIKIFKCSTTRKLSSKIGLTEEDLLNIVSFKSIKEVNNYIGSFMKTAYNSVFFYIKSKIDAYLSVYFYSINTKSSISDCLQDIGIIKKEENLNFIRNKEEKGKINFIKNEIINQEKERLTVLSESNKKSNLKIFYSILIENILSKQNQLEQYKKLNRNNTCYYINFIDNPGEIHESSLGGLITNLTNEAVNSFASTQYSYLIDYLNKENIYLKHHRKFLKSERIIGEILKKDGLFDKILLNKESNISNDIIEWDSKGSLFQINFSNTSIIFNIENLKDEISTCLYNQKIYKTIEKSSNPIIQWYFYQNKNFIYKDFKELVSSKLQKLILPLENTHPFVIYCVKAFNLLMSENENLEFILNHKKTISLLKNSLVMPILYWEWFGFHDWMDINEFNDIFFGSFVKIMLYNDKLNKGKLIFNISDIEKYNKYEKASSVLESFVKTGNYIIGKTKILLKKNNLEGLVNIMNMTIRNLNLQSSKTITKTSLKSRKNSNNHIKIDEIIYEDNKNKQPENFEICNLNDSEIIERNFQRRRTITIQCHINIQSRHIKKEDYKDQEHIGFKKIEKLLKNGEYELFSSKSENDRKNKEYEDYLIKSNIITPSKETFTLMKNLLVGSNNKSKYNNINYNNHIEKIILIQSIWRSYVINLKYKKYQYVIDKIVLIQSIRRGILTRKKFKNYVKMLYSLIIIQRFYRNRFNKKSYYALVLQTNIRRFLIRNRIHKMKEYLNDKDRNRLSIKEKSELNEILKFNKSSPNIENSKKQSKKSQVHVNLRSVNYTNTASKKETKFNSKKSLEKINTHINSNTNLIRLGNKKDEKDNINSVDMVIKDMKLLNNTTNKNKIINTLLNGMNEFIKDDIKNQGKKGSVFQEEYGVDDLKEIGALNKNRNGVEDRLIEYGKQLKLKKQAIKYDKEKRFLDEFSFEPKVNKYNKINMSSIDMSSIENNEKSETNHVSSDFLQRQKEFLIKSKLNREKIKSEIKDPEEKELVFKPEISKKSNQLVSKRRIEDLFLWNEKIKKENKEKEIQRRKEIERKEEEELREINRLMRRSLFHIPKNLTKPEKELKFLNENKHENLNKHNSVYKNDCLDEDINKSNDNNEEINLWPDRN